MPVTIDEVSAEIAPVGEGTPVASNSRNSSGEPREVEMRKAMDTHCYMAVRAARLRAD